MGNSDALAGNMDSISPFTSTIPAVQHPAPAAEQSSSGSGILGREFTLPFGLPCPQF